MVNFRQNIKDYLRKLASSEDFSFEKESAVIEKTKSIKAMIAAVVNGANRV